MDHGLKAWQAYGGPKVCLVRSTPRFADDIVALRNDTDVADLSHQEPRDRQSHLIWLARQDMAGRNAHFVILSKGAFAGMVSLDNVMPGKTAELRRFAMLAGDLASDALAAEFLTLSYALQVLGCRSLWCAVSKETPRIIDFHRENGWSLFPQYDRPASTGRLRGLRFGREAWQPAIEARGDELAASTGVRPEDWALAAIPEMLGQAEAS